jgi:putative FmdB family regulatory protein
MPIYEYSCRECGVEFEKLVASQAAVACPSCASGQVIRRISLVGIRTGGLGANASPARAPQGGCCGGGCGCHS